MNKILTNFHKFVFYLLTVVNFKKLKKTMILCFYQIIKVLMNNKIK